MHPTHAPKHRQETDDIQTMDASEVPKLTEKGRASLLRVAFSSDPTYVNAHEELAPHLLRNINQLSNAELEKLLQIDTWKKRILVQMPDFSGMQRERIQDAMPRGFVGRMFHSVRQVVRFIMRTPLPRGLAAKDVEEIVRRYWVRAAGPHREQHERLEIMNEILDDYFDPKGHNGRSRLTDGQLWYFYHRPEVRIEAVE